MIPLVSQNDTAARIILPVVLLSRARHFQVNCRARYNSFKSATEVQPSCMGLHASISALHALLGKTKIWLFGEN
jgi:hypothetical protein